MAQERQRQEQEEQERQAAAQQAAQRRQLVGSMRSSVYLQRLRVQRTAKQQQKQAGDLPDWAKAARPLPPLLPPQSARQAPAQPRQEVGACMQGQQPAASAANRQAPAPSADGTQQTRGVGGQPLEQQQQQQQQQQQPSEQQQQQQQRTLTEEEQQLQESLACLDARLPPKGGWFERSPLHQPIAVVHNPWLAFPSAILSPPCKLAQQGQGGHATSCILS